MAKELPEEPQTLVEILKQLNTPVDLPSIAYNGLIELGRAKLLETKFQQNITIVRGSALETFLSQNMVQNPKLDILINQMKERYGLIPEDTTNLKDEINYIPKDVGNVRLTVSIIGIPPYICYQLAPKKLQQDILPYLCVPAILLASSLLTKYRKLQIAQKAIKIIDLEEGIRKVGDKS